VSAEGSGLRFSPFLSLRVGPSAIAFARSSSSLARSAGVRIYGLVMDGSLRDTFEVARVEVLGSVFGGGG
jgi:hypothetical protein